MNYKIDALEKDVSFQLIKTLGVSRWFSWGVSMCWLYLSVKNGMVSS